jgi:hypothetical protein
MSSSKRLSDVSNPRRRSKRQKEHVSDSPSSPQKHATSKDVDYRGGNSPQKTRGHPDVEYHTGDSPQKTPGHRDVNYVSAALGSRKRKPVEVDGASPQKSSGSRDVDYKQSLLSDGDSPQKHDGSVDVDYRVVVVPRRRRGLLPASPESPQKTEFHRDVNYKRPLGGVPRPPATPATASPSLPGGDGPSLPSGGDNSSPRPSTPSRPGGDGGKPVASLPDPPKEKKKKQKRKKTATKKRTHTRSDSSDASSDRSQDSPTRTPSPTPTPTNIKPAGRSRTRPDSAPGGSRKRSNSVHSSPSTSASPSPSRPRASKTKHSSSSSSSPSRSPSLPRTGEKKKKKKKHPASSPSPPRERLGRRSRHRRRITATRSDASPPSPSPSRRSKAPQSTPVSRTPSPPVGDGGGDGDGDGKTPAASPPGTPPLRGSTPVSRAASVSRKSRSRSTSSSPSVSPSPRASPWISSKGSPRERRRRRSRHRTITTTIPPSVPFVLPGAAPPIDNSVQNDYTNNIDARRVTFNTDVRGGDRSQTTVLVDATTRAGDTHHHHHHHQQPASPGAGRRGSMLTPEHASPSPLPGVVSRLPPRQSPSLPGSVVSTPIQPAPVHSLTLNNTLYHTMQDFSHRNNNNNNNNNDNRDLNLSQSDNSRRLSSIFLPRPSSAPKQRGAVVLPREKKQKQRKRNKDSSSSSSSSSSDDDNDDERKVPRGDDDEPEDPARIDASLLPPPPPVVTLDDVADHAVHRFIVQFAQLMRYEAGPIGLFNFLGYKKARQMYPDIHLKRDEFLEILILPYLSYYHFAVHRALVAIQLMPQLTPVALLKLKFSVEQERKLQTVSLLHILYRSDLVTLFLNIVNAITTETRVDLGRYSSPVSMKTYLQQTLSDLRQMALQLTQPHGMPTKPDKDLRDRVETSISLTLDWTKQYYWLKLPQVLVDQQPASTANALFRAQVHFACLVRDALQDRLRFRITVAEYAATEDSNTKSEYRIQEFNDIADITQPCDIINDVIGNPPAQAVKNALLAIKTAVDSKHRMYRKMESTELLNKLVLDQRKRVMLADLAGLMFASNRALTVRGDARVAVQRRIQSGIEADLNFFSKSIAI